MSLNKSAFLLTLALFETVQANEVKCPPFYRNIPLSGAVLYDGSPNEMADLIPDKSTGTGDHANSFWEVGYIYEARRNLYLLCKYGPSDSITVRVEKKVPRTYTFPAASNASLVA